MSPRHHRRERLGPMNLSIRRIMSKGWGLDPNARPPFDDIWPSLEKDKFRLMPAKPMHLWAGSAAVRPSNIQIVPPSCCQRPSEIMRRLKRWQRQPNKRRWMISVTTAKELLFLNKSEIKGYGVTYPVGGRTLESVNALHVHIQHRALAIGPCMPSLMSRTYETPIHQIKCTQNEDKNECKDKARVLLSSDILRK
jgi:hypothetical protein